MKLFVLHCTTCQARIKVTDRAALGQILACPKCESMVQIVPPEGWVDPGDLPAEHAATAACQAQAAPKPGISKPPPLPKTTPAASGKSTVMTPVRPALTLSADDDEPTSRTVLWIGGAAIAAAVAIAAMVIFSRGGNEPAAAAGDPAATAEDNGATEKTDNPPIEAAPTAVVKPEPPAPAEQPPAATVHKPVEQTVAEPADALKPAADPPAAEVRPIVVEHAGPPAPKPPWLPLVDLAAKAKPRGKAQFDIGDKVLIDVKPRLAHRLPSVEFANTPLFAFFDTFSGLSGVPVAVDVQAFADLGIKADRQVTAKFTDAALSDVLQVALIKQGLSYEIAENAVIITRPAAQPATRRYSVADLCDGSPAARETLSAVARQFVAPAEWADPDAGSLRVEGDVFHLRHREAVHQQFIVLCEKLRAARGKPLRSKGDPERFKLTTRTAQAQRLLAEPVTAHFVTPRSLHDVIAYLQQSSGGTLWLDWTSLAAQGLLPSTTLTLDVENQPLGEVLDLLCAATEIRYRVIDAKTIEVVAAEKLDDLAELEIFPVGDLLRPAFTHEDLVARVSEQLARLFPEAPSATLHYDALSRCLLVYQPQPAHVDLERVLGVWRRGIQAGVSMR